MQFSYFEFCWFKPKLLAIYRLLWGRILIKARYWLLSAFVSLLLIFLLFPFNLFSIWVDSIASKNGLWFPFLSHYHGLKLFHVLTYCSYESNCSYDSNYSNWLLGSFEKTLDLFHRLFGKKMFQAQLRDSLHRLIFPHFSRKSWKWKVKVKAVQSCPNLGDSMNCTGVGSLSLLQGIFPTQVSNPGLTHCRWILYQLSHKGSPQKVYFNKIKFAYII